MSINTVLAAALVTMPLAMFSPAQAGEGNGPGLGASNFGSWTFVQDSAEPTDLRAEGYVSQGRFTEMAPEAVTANFSAESPVPAGRALMVGSTTQGNVALARAATGKRPGG